MTYKEALRLIWVWHQQSPFTKGVIWIDGTPCEYPINGDDNLLKEFWKMVSLLEAEFTLHGYLVDIQAKLLNKLTIIHNDPIQKEEC